jgi:hypothetical protein
MNCTVTDLATGLKRHNLRGQWDISMASKVELVR